MLSHVFRNCMIVCLLGMTQACSTAAPPAAPAAGTMEAPKSELAPNACGSCTSSSGSKVSCKNVNGIPKYTCSNPVSTCYSSCI